VEHQNSVNVNSGQHNSSGNDSKHQAFNRYTDQLMMQQDGANLEDLPARGRSTLLPMLDQSDMMAQS